MHGFSVDGGNRTHGPGAHRTDAGSDGLGATGGPEGPAPSTAANYFKRAALHQKTQLLLQNVQN